MVKRALILLAFCLISLQILSLNAWADEEKEKELQKKLKELKSLQSLGMTFGHTDEKTGDK